MFIFNLYIIKGELSMSPELTHKVIPDWYFEKYGIKSHH